MEILEEDKYKNWEKSTEEYDKLTTSFRTLRIRYNDLRRLAAPVNTGIEEKDDCSDESDAESIRMSQSKKADKNCGAQEENTGQYDLHDTCKSKVLKLIIFDSHMKQRAAFPLYYTLIESLRFCNRTDVY